MGILLANVGYASTKSVFFLVLGTVIIASMCHYGYKKIKEHSRYQGQKISALSAYTQDTNPAWMRAAVINTMTTYSTSPRLVHEHMPEIITRLSSDQQPGGRLYNLIRERRSGQISRQIFRDKLDQYVRYLAAEYGVPYN
jgi:hypothetical protein